MTEKSCWILTEGMAGTENQCLGLAEALGLEPEVKRIALRAPWRWLPVASLPWPLAAQGKGADPLRPPWPDLLISAGRKSVAPALAIKAKAKGRTFTVHLLNPYGRRLRFDLVAVPRHDRMHGKNVVVTEGALNRITPERLRSAFESHGERLGRMQKPLLAVLLGGASKRFRFTERAAEELGVLLRAVAAETGGSLLITPSRRTEAWIMVKLRAELEGLPAEIWDGTGDNPYFAYLAAADGIVVTNDSISMASEAATTGKPVFVFALEGRTRKFLDFHENLRAKGITRPFDGTFASWVYEPLDDTARVAAAVRARWSS